MIQYPLQFRVRGQALAGVRERWSMIAENSQVPNFDATILVAVPPEFEGPGLAYSPEDFYALALANCFVATFKVISEKSKLNYKSLNAQGTLTIDRDEKGAPWMKAFHLNVELVGATDIDRAHRLLEKTSQSCMILNSVKTEKTFDFDVT
jgi:organic hydroperoxide reductase OsmC/OhrA